MHYSWRSKKQRGVAAIIVGLSLFVLMGFAGLVIDVGRLFVTKTELQSAVDACALAGARFINSPTKSQLEIAASVGKSVGEINKAIFQAETAAITEVYFSDRIDGAYGIPLDDAQAKNMRYIRCAATKSSIINSFMQLFGFEKSAVAAVAKASLVGGGTNCMLPVAMCVAEKEGSPAAFVPGKWYEGRIDAAGPGATPIDGSFRWIKFPGDSPGASSFIDRLLSKSCQVIGTNVQVDSEPGQMSSVDKAFNTKFGVYQNPYKLTDNPRAMPDPVGIAYLEPGFESGKPAGDRAYDSYKNDRFKSYQSPAAINFNPTPGVDTNLGTSNPGGLQKRLLLLPVVNCNPLGGGGSTAIEEVACMLALHPIGQNKSEVDGGPKKAITDGNVDCNEPLDADLSCKNDKVALNATNTGNCNCSTGEVASGSKKCTGSLVCYTGGKKDITNLMRMEYIDDGGAGSPCGSLGAPGPGFAKVPGLVQ
jgi:hypothetical protein